MKRTFVFAILLIAAGLAYAATMELTSARLYKKQGEWLKSWQFYNDAIKKEPGNLEAYFERGELLKDIVIDKSKSGLAKEIAGDSPKIEAELYKRILADFKEAQVFRKSGDDGVIKKLKKKIDIILEERWFSFYSEAVKEDSLYTKAVENQASDADPKEHLTRALASLDFAIMIDPELWNSYGLKAQIYAKLDNQEASAENWRIAMQKIEASDLAKKKPEDYQQAIDVIRGNLLDLYYSLERHDATIELANSILQKDAKNVDAIQFKAFSLARKASDTTLTVAQRDQMKADAIFALNAAREARPDEPVILYYIGQFHLQLGDTAKAVATFEDYLKVDSTDREVRFALGVIYLEGGSFTNTERARDEFAKLVEIDPNDGSAWINYGIALIRLGDNSKGKEYIEKGKAIRE